VSGQSPEVDEIDRGDIARVARRDESSDYGESTTAAEEPRRRVQDQDQGGDIMQVSLDRFWKELTSRSGVSLLFLCLGGQDIVIASHEIWARPMTKRNTPSP
jgi:hypothetical protein